jgi:hypothetical protein
VRLWRQWVARAVYVLLAATMALAPPSDRLHFLRITTTVLVQVRQRAPRHRSPAPQCVFLTYVAAAVGRPGGGGASGPGDGRVDAAGCDASQGTSSCALSAYVC